MNEEIIENVKTVNRHVEFTQKYLKEHSKEVYEIKIIPMGFEKGHVKIEMTFNSSDSMLKEAQKIIIGEK